MDATGLILNDVKDQSKILLYSIVMHDKINKCIIPVAEFFSSNQETTTINKYLIEIKREIEINIQSSSKFKIAPIIITDFSWAIINSILEIFNRCSINHYLE
jgi:hypothetical protein